VSEDSHGEPIDWDLEGDRLAAKSLAAGEPTMWFEQLYAAAATGRVHMPWSRTEPQPLLVEWARAHASSGSGKRAIVVGCGLGADAEYVASRGFDTIGFDISETAIGIARQRFPDSPVHYQVADLLDPPRAWLRAFDLVVEIITVQALPDPPRHDAITNVGRFVGSGGTLLVIAAAHDDDDPPSSTPPWPLRRDEVEAFAEDGLSIHRVELVPMPGRTAAKRWRAELRRLSD
jgi:threonine dehydrogenase-like Zn-dependent dehydrogenase